MATKEASWIEKDWGFYYGETSLTNNNFGFGRGIGIGKKPPFALYEGWWKNDCKHGRGRRITDDQHMYEGNFTDGYRNGDGVYKWPDGK